MAEEIKAGDVLEEAVVEKATEEPVAEEKEEVLDYTNSFNVSDLSFKFYDPDEILPAEYRADIPEDKKVFVLKYSDLFNVMGDKYNSMIAGENAYAYAAFDKVTQSPTLNYKLVKGLVNDLVANDKAVLVCVFDPNIGQNQVALVTKLVEETLIKFRIPYSEVVVNPNIVTATFSKENENGVSFVTPVPVHDPSGKTMMFMAYSVDVRPIDTEAVEEGVVDEEPAKTEEKE